MNKKKLLTIVAVIAICSFSVWGCIKNRDNEVVNNNIHDIDEDINKDDGNAIKYSATSYEEAYKKIILDFYNEHKFPDDTSEDILDPNYDMSLNSFAIKDVDNDGREELLLALSHHPMASMRTIMYDYDLETQSLREQLVEFPAMRFYENGVIIAEWSHNQGSAGDTLWPYTLYKYNENSDTYSVVAQADAWNKNFQTESYLAEEFPTEIDKDGDGIIYYILPEGGYKDIYALDFAEYDEWLKAIIPDGLTQIEVEYQKMTLENIENIGK